MILYLGSDLGKIARHAAAVDFGPQQQGTAAFAHWGRVGLDTGQFSGT
jgi:hypothetical protein